MQAPDLAVKEMERIRDKLGMRGIEVNSNINGLELDDPRFYPIFEAAWRNWGWPSSFIPGAAL